MGVNHRHIKIIITFLDYNMIGLFSPLEVYGGPSVLAEGVLCFVASRISLVSRNLLK
jgi:hypothetical protein